jgi:pre-rRNA-processing protein TSR4
MCFLQKYMFLCVVYGKYPKQHPYLSTLMFDKTPEVWLGIPDKKVPTANADPLASKMGGAPVWLTAAPDPELLICPHCTSALRFVLQAYAPLGDHLDRVLYVFACDTTACSGEQGGWCVLRQQKIVNRSSGKDERSAEERKAIAEIDASMRASTSSDSSSSSSSAAAPSAMDTLQALLAKRDAQLAAGAPVVQPKASNKGKGKKAAVTYQENSFFLDICEEPEADESEDDEESVGADHEAVKDIDFKGKEHKLVNLGDDNEEDEEDDGDEAIDMQEQMELLRQFEAQTGDMGVTDAEWEDLVSFLEQSKDPVFAAFEKRLAREPEQVVRWQFRGSPLWATKQVPEPYDITPCEHCGSDRVFEMQILPTIITPLGCDIEHGMDFATVAIYTCSESCPFPAVDRALPEFIWVQRPVAVPEAAHAAHGSGEHEEGDDAEDGDHDHASHAEAGASSDQ